MIGSRAVFLAAALGLLGACGKEPTGRYNVVLISIDSLRADRTGPYGHAPEFAPDLKVTPNLDRLAQSGAVFEDAWTSSSWTLPAHASLMTGLTDRAHGVEHDDFAMDPLHRTLAEALRADGYATGGCYSGPYLDPKYGFGRGFEDYRSGMMNAEQLESVVQRQVARMLAEGIALTPKEIKAIRDRVSHWDLTSPRVNAFAREFLDRHAGERFFLFLHYFDAHYDYLPDQGDRETARRFDPDYRGTFHGEDWFFDEKQRVMTWPDAESPWGRRTIGERDLRHALALYDAEIHWVDRHVGEVLDRIAALGLEDETIVIVTADHGDEFFDHGSIAHRSTLYSELCRIPLVLRVPGAGQAGQRVTRLARIYDLAPSVLDWCGLPPLPGAQGASLRPLLEGAETPARSSLHRVYARFNRDRLGNHNVREAFRDEEFTVVRHLEPLDRQSTPQGLPFAAWPDPRHGREYLVYDRVADPRELRPLEESDPRWRRAVDAYCAAWTQCEREAAALPRSPLRERWSAAKSAEEMALLAGLGYAGYADGEGASAAPRHPELLPFPPPCPAD